MSKHCRCRISEFLRPFSFYFLWGWLAQLRVSPDRDPGERGCQAARGRAIKSGNSQDIPASVRSPFLAAAAVAAAAACREALPRAEEVDPKAFPVPVSVRGAAAAAAAGAEMPKGGEGVGARGSRDFARGGRGWAATVPSTRGPLGDPRRRRPFPPPHSQAWASTLNCPAWETGSQWSRASPSGILRKFLGVRSSPPRKREPRSRSSEPGERLELPSHLAGRRLSHRVPRWCGTCPPRAESVGSVGLQLGHACLIIRPRLNDVDSGPPCFDSLLAR